MVGIFSIPTCARKSANAESNIDRIEELAASATVLGTDLDTARGYGEIKTALQLKGRPIPENDLWIAAIGIVPMLVETAQAPIVTFDTGNPSEEISYR